MDVITAKHAARQLIQSETDIQDNMWGAANERADVTGPQLLKAALAQLALVDNREQHHMSEQSALELAKSQHYPKDWSGFRDYGTYIANLVVAAAYIEQEIKRRLMNGDSSVRRPRGSDETYDPRSGLPLRSSAEVTDAKV